MTPRFQATLAVLGNAHPVVRDLARAQRSGDALDELIVEAGLAELPPAERNAIDESARYIAAKMH
ncbi:MAG: hypothetical protein ACK5U4_25480 [Rhodospirillales bacterium]